MPARTGEEYLCGLREQCRAVWIRGERVEDVTTHPAFRHGAQSVAALYDMQHDPALQDVMTYASPTTAARVGLSFITPHTLQDLGGGEAALRQHRLFENRHQLALERTVAAFGTFAEELRQLVGDVLDRQVRGHSSLGRVVPNWSYYRTTLTSRHLLVLAAPRIPADP